MNTPKYTEPCTEHKLRIPQFSKKVNSLQMKQVVDFFKPGPAISLRTIPQRLTVFALFFLVSISYLCAQPMSDYIAAAENAYERGDYNSAKEFYAVAIKFDTTRMDLWYRLGESSQNFDAYRTASQAYDKVAASTYRDSFPLLTYNQASVLQLQGKYVAAADLFDSFLANAEALDDEEIDADILEDAERNLINANWAADVVSRRDDVEVNHLSGDVNSAYSDFAPYFKNDSLYYSSLRYRMKGDKVRPRRKVSKIAYQLSSDTTSSLLSNTINQEGRIIAHSAYDAAGTTVYFTICDYIESSTDFKCEIYCASVDKKSKWGTPKRLPINEADSYNTHPNIGVDPKTGNEYLYFVSDRDGGKGGFDIYRTEILADGECGPVEPMEEINTDRDDLTPFYYAPTQVLYFSTDGRLTMGGYDIYRAAWNGSGWDRPTHMGVPVNSSYDDLYYSRFLQKEQAYFASKRADSLAIFWDETHDACCHDIYSIGITDEIKLLATTWHALEETELPGTSVALYEIGPGGNRLIDSLYNPSANDFNFTVVPGKTYELVARKPGYSIDRDTLDLTDPELISKKEIERKLYLSPDLELDVFTFNKLDSTALAGATVYLYEITPEGEYIVVDSIVNPTANDHHFKLRRGKQYQVYARKDGYIPAETFIDTNDPELAEVNKISRDLYLKPGLSLEVYTYRLLDSLPLNQTTVYLFEYSDAEGEKLVDSITNPYGHQFGFEVFKGKKYVIRADREAYGPAVTSLDLSGPEVPETGTYRKDIYLGQLLEIFTFDAETELPLPGAEVSLIDPVTGELIADKLNPDSNDFYFSISLDKPYRLKVTRKGYAPVEEIISFSKEELEAGGGKITFDVFLEPFKDPATMLPLYLYFDNDHPNPRSTSPTTDQEYVSTNVEYYKKKQNFIQSFTTDMPLEEAFLMRRRFDDFFNLEVRGGRYDLEEFSKRLLAYLEAGNSFTIDLQGFASPRASSEYNKILSARRIDAVMNFFEQYENGRLYEFAEIYGTLDFNRIPNGETKADPRVTDQLDDTKNSVYNVFASLERRVEVRAANSNDN